MTKELIGGDKVEGVYDLRDKSNESNVQGRLHLSVQYVSKDKLDKMEAGKELRRSYFPAKQGKQHINCTPVHHRYSFHFSLVCTLTHSMD